MADPVGVRIDFDSASLRRVAALSGVTKNRLYVRLDRFMADEAPRVAKGVAASTLRGQVLKRRTGRLARSVEGHALRFRGVPSLRVGVFRGFALGQAAAHEYGADIRPKNARALAVPVQGGPATTSGGRSKFAGPREYPGKLFFIPFRSGKAVVGGLFEKRRGGRRGRLVYVLVTRVRLKKRGWLSKGLDRQLPDVSSRLERLLTRVLAGAEAV